MSKSLIDLLSILDLEQLEVNLFRGNSPKTDWQRVFGGQVIGHEAMELGINGVPFFVINRRYGVSGAQPPEALLDALEMAWNEAHPAAAESGEVGA